MTASEAGDAGRNARARLAPVARDGDGVSAKRTLIRPCPTCGATMRLVIVRGHAEFHCVSVTCCDGRGER